MKNLIVIFGIVVSFTFLYSCGSDSTTGNASGLIAESIDVFGNCGMCKKRIEEAAKSIDGVEIAVWNKETKVLDLGLNEGVNLDKVHQVIADVGHDTEKIKANDDVYSELPGCCLYREGDSEGTH
jgi:copper chaperone CopZ